MPRLQWFLLLSLTLSGVTGSYVWAESSSERCNQNGVAKNTVSREAVQKHPHQYAGEELTFFNLALDDMGQSWLYRINSNTGQKEFWLTLSFKEEDGVDSHDPQASTPFMLHPYMLHRIQPYLSSPALMHITGTVLGLANKKQIGSLVIHGKPVGRNPSILHWVFLIDHIQIVNECMEEQDVLDVPMTNMKLRLQQDVNHYFFERDGKIQ